VCADMTPMSLPFLMSQFSLSSCDLMLEFNECPCMPVVILPCIGIFNELS